MDNHLIVDVEDFSDELNDKMVDLGDCKVSLVSAHLKEPDMITEVGDEENYDSEKGSSCSESSRDPDYVCATRKIFKHLELDPENAEWKAARNRLLIEGILELETPVITDKMIDFLLQDGVCEILLGYITQIDPQANGKVERIARDTTAESGTMELKRSFRATMLLSREDPTDALLAFLGKKAGAITGKIFELFEPASKGVLQHGCRLIDHLLKHHTNEVFETISESVKRVESSLGLMMQHLYSSTVAECFVKIITQPSLQQPNCKVKVAPQKKWKLYQALAEWRLLIKLAKHITDPEYCFAHVSNAADVMLQIIEKLAADSNGEILLQPIGHCPELVSSLVSMLADAGRPLERRTEAARVLQGLAQKAIEEQIVCFNIWQLTLMGGVQPTIPNQLKGVKDLYFSQMNEHFQTLAETVTEDLGAVPSGSNAENEKIVHPGFVVEKPFTLMRFLVTKIIVEVGNQDPEQLNKLSVEFWRACCQWLVKYPHNDLYHALFHQLASKALRSNQEEALKRLLQKCKLVTHLVSICRNPALHTVHGAATKLCNTLRLQAETLPPSSFLRGFLASHTTWREFLPKLRELTVKEQQYGLGFSVPVPTVGVPNIMPQQLQGGIEGGIDLGSRFARSLGFEDHDIPWPVAAPSLSKSRKRKKKKGKGGQQRPQSPDSATNTEDSPTAGTGDTPAATTDGDPTATTEDNPTVRTEPAQAGVKEDLKDGCPIPSPSNNSDLRKDEDNLEIPDHDHFSLHID